ncbi:MAG: hypothetical protein ACYCWW_17310 [Deltaproteobacteria bacterium]
MKRWLFLPLLVTGCASLNYRPLVTPFGAVRATAMPDVMADDMSWGEARDVRVMVGELPPGIAWGPEGLVIQDPRYRVVGDVAAFPKWARLANLGLWFYDYPQDQGWRNVYCDVQVPLSWVTLTLWSWLSPTYYPCRTVETNFSYDVDQRRMRIIETLRKAAKASGGNLLIVTHLGNRHWARFTRWGGEIMGIKEMMNGEGVAIYDSGRPASAR